jgi:hypothetical protein
MHREEINPADLARFNSELHQVLEAVCKSPHFSTSPKSCEFLRYIVCHALLGSRDELKERLIGMALLGRTADYDTGSDAGVRVRANDVRKRLNAYRASCDSDEEFVIELPAGTYIPRFFRSDLQTAEAKPDTEQMSAALMPAGSTPPLSLQTLAFPTIVALFLCTVCIRWQLTQERPFTTFWQAAFQDRHAFLYLPPSGSGPEREMISRDSFEAAAPLLNLAGQFHAQVALTRNPEPQLSSDDILVTIGLADSANSHSDIQPGAGTVSPLKERIVVEDTRQGRQVVDMGNSGLPAPIAGRAAVLTISNGPRREIQIDGTDDAAIRALVNQLCERDTFPQDLTDSFQAGTITQAVFPFSAKPEVRVLHESLPESGYSLLSQ